MQALRFCVFVSSLLFVTISALGQQASQLSPAATKDPQAIIVLNQALAAAGGSTAIASIQDYAVIGAMTVHMSPTQDTQGRVTIRGRGLGELRIDSDLSSDSSSKVILGGQISEKGKDGIVRPSYDEAPLLASRFVLPWLPFTPFINSAHYSVLYKGTVQIDGRSTYDIQVQRTIPQITDPNDSHSKSFSIDFYVDASSFQVNMVQDIVYKRMVHQVRYSDYRVLGGILVPFTITQAIDGQPESVIQLNNVQLNAGLTDSDFQP